MTSDEAYNLFYRGEHAKLAGATEELLAMLSEVTFEDGYSRAWLLAEISSQHLLRGNAKKSKESLDAACGYVYQINNPRLEVLLNFKIAVLWNTTCSNTWQRLRR